MFQKAVRTQRKLKMCLFGPSGGGKTFTGLTVLSNLVGPQGRIAVIDTEASSASAYADEFSFDVQPLTEFSVTDYVDAINEAVRLGYDGLLVDSTSHAWNGAGGILERVEEHKKAHRAGNDFAAWGIVKPDETKLWAALTQSPIHLICTMRSKTEYEISQDEKTGKKKVEKLGLAPIQRQDLEYEFDVVGRMDIDNTLVIVKSRCTPVNGRVFDKPGKDFAAILAKWCDSGESTPAPAIPTNGNAKAPAPPPASDIHRTLWAEWLALRDAHSVPKDLFLNRIDGPFRDTDPERIAVVLDGIRSEFASATEPEQEEIPC
jgi:hypothetical protein